MSAEEDEAWSVTDFISGIFSSSDEEEPLPEAPEITPEQAQEAIDNNSYADVWDGITGWVADQGQDIAQTSIVNQLPGAGTLFNYSAGDGLSFTPLGQKLLLGAAAYGVWRLTAK